MSFMKRGSALVVGFGSIALLLQGCGKDTVADTVAREKDRELEATQANLSEAQAIKGTYRGEAIGRDTGIAGPSGAPAGDRVYEITAYFDSLLANKDGMLAPQATVVGSFTVIKRNSFDTDGKPKKTVMSFKDGVYSAKLAQLAVTIQGLQGGDTILINCKVLDGFRMKCKWHSLVAEQRFSFDLIRQ